MADDTEPDKAGAEAPTAATAPKSSSADPPPDRAEGFKLGNVLRFRLPGKLDEVRKFRDEAIRDDTHSEDEQDDSRSR